ncbi:ABC-2 type transport system ATP-binding protein [Blastococcus xanthinilyticus]|uniref:ABC-2 type transport system ATP-binding protein n=1 Tax=Blastococcus xanthinilyticus TaxID=1564164 RepID=A0A5S5CZ51_9ACTN|nr:ABC-2 type transport system ATP-binding protein [Blastococcus xanthinilyticus]
MRVDGLLKRYGEKVAVRDVSFEVGEGEVFGILGPNGAGKTTTVESIAGLRVGDGGAIRVLGIDPWADRPALTRVLGVQLQESRLQPKITVDEALTLWSSFYDDPVPWRGLVDRLGLGAQGGTRFADLSGGQQQRLSIALALVGRPRVAILDELSTGLDPQARRQVWEIVRELRADGVTVLLVTHSMEEAQQLCDRIAIIDGGRIRALDTPEGLIRGATAATVTTFTASAAVDLEDLRAAAGVSSVRADAGRIVVEGADGAALAVLDRLRQQRVTPSGLRIVDGSLDTAYLDLTSTTSEEQPA